MTHRTEIRFLLNGADVAAGDVPADQTLLDYLRLERRLTGSKEGCAEGDCGACTVLVGRLHDGALKYETVNACIRFLASLDGCHVVTIEHLKGRDGGLHPIQQAMVDYHGSQCGFCTPGFVMSLYALWMENPEPAEHEVESAIQGNLCRCTGYQPIVAAAMAANRYGSPANDFLQGERDEITRRLSALKDGRRVVTGPEDNRAIIPADVADFADILSEWPEATIVAGATDVGLWVTKFMRPIGPAVFIGNLGDLKAIHLTESALEIGAGVTYSEAQGAITERFPHLGAYWDRIAGSQVRNMGTIGGNIANGSPIGDTPPVLIALGAQIVLRKGQVQRTLPLEDFFIEYGKQDRAPGEFVERIVIPRPAPGQLDAAYKISKRRDEDISSIAAGFCVTVDNGVITDCRLAFGGMAGTPKRAGAAEAALRGQPWGKAAFAAAGKALEADFTPLTDWRASAQYRMSTARNLLLRFYLAHDDTTAEPVDLLSA
ncbi:xanthine dehydrogenase small subunit [Roseibium salinum]|uniref:Xanthine dehydrogenase small subunit n=1 Tax=Roseibium salinum TaxID=1604349 RepID=A0ABT3R6I4_9HYPH|nr:xanthine dehydrogenase small subunit [Roseibium sp. DSM 29163]MCX2724643.1 xanthine dehydrogenase small subunit [Roseibium sp. DSM 29163]